MPGRAGDPPDFMTAYNQLSTTPKGGFTWLQLGPGVDVNIPIGSVAKDAHSASNIRYRVAAAEDSGLKDRSVDLITVAQAVHWFDLGKFYAEARRVLRPAG